MHLIITTPLYEPCGSENLVVSLNYPAKDTLVVHFDAMYGTAANGVDFVHIPDSVIFLPGMQHTEIPVVVISDTLTEGTEYFTIVIHNTLYSDTATFWIRDSVNNPFTYQLNHHELILCPNATLVQLNASPNGGANQVVVTWTTTGPQQVNAIVDHQCGFISTGIGVDVVTGVEDLFAPSDLMVWQTEGRKWKISGENLSGKLSLQVMDMEGRLITSSMLSADGGTLNHALDLQSLSSGIYVLTIGADNGLRFREKIVCW